MLTVKLANFLCNTICENEGEHLKNTVFLFLCRNELDYFPGKSKMRRERQIDIRESTRMNFGKLLGTLIVAFIGGTIGMNFTKSSLAEMKQVFFPAVTSVLILLTVGVIAGYILHKVAGIDLITALLGTSPGGLTDMTILAAAFEADTIIVSSIHLVRLFSVILLMPIFVRIISTYINK